MIYIKKLFLFLILINISFSNQIDYSEVNFNDFGFSLFKEINSSNSSDFSISPISVAYALMMTNTGASGQTSDEILSILGLSNSDLKKTHNHLKFYIADSKNNNLTFGNSIWIQNDRCYMPNQDYVNKISSIFNGKREIIFKKKLFLSFNRLYSYVVNISLKKCSNNFISFLKKKL